MGTRAAPNVPPVEGKTPGSRHGRMPRVARAEMTQSKLVHSGELSERRIRRQLLVWYEERGRELPWRAAQRGAAQDRPDPYAILVSEAMLQQTQVATVVQYFRRFMTRFPTLEMLAEADEQEVLQLWQGLGYYRRARHLHAAARVIAHQFGGSVPADTKHLEQLPGVGRYTAGAVASIAFGKRAAILDGNVARVLARLLAVREPVDEPTTRTQLWSHADALVSPTQPGDFNQALMDLGAMVCTPRHPQCRECPLHTECRAYMLGLANQLPVRGRRAKVQPAVHSVVALRHGDRYLFEQRASKGLWSNMWQLPTLEAPTESSGRGLADWVWERFDSAPRALELQGEFRHRTTHRAIRFVVFDAPLHASPSPVRPGLLWRTLGDIGDLPLPNPQHRAIALLRDDSRQLRLPTD